MPMSVLAVIDNKGKVLILPTRGISDRQVVAHIGSPRFKRLPVKF
jgi:hypothetical protein